MTRDMDLVRTLLHRIEDMKITAGGVYMIGAGDSEMEVEGHSYDEVYYNFQLLIQQGLIAGPDRQGGGHFMVTGLSWEGHEFLDTIRNPEVWDRTKAGLKKVGGVGFDLVIALAKAEGKRFIQEKLGIPLP